MAAAAGLVTNHPTGWEFLKTDQRRGWAIMLLIIVWTTAMLALVFFNVGCGDSGAEVSTYGTIGAGGEYMGVLVFGIIFEVLFLVAYCKLGLDKLANLKLFGPVNWYGLEFGVQVSLLVCSVALAIGFGFGIASAKGAINDDDVDDDECKDERGFGGFVYALVRQPVLGAMPSWLCVPIHVLVCVRAWGAGNHVQGRGC